MITIIIAIIAYYLATKGKRSHIMMMIYATVMSIYYIIQIFSAANSERTDSIFLFSLEYILELIICIITIYSTNKKADKIQKMKVLSQIVSNFKLKEQRINNKLTPKQVAGIIGIKENLYEKYELGQEDIPVSTLIQLAQLYKVSTDHLVGITFQDVQKTDLGNEQQ